MLKVSILSVESKLTLGTALLIINNVCHDKLLKFD